MRNWHQYLGALLLGVFLAACGGGGSDTVVSTPVAVSPAAQAFTGPATDKGVSIDNRKRTLSDSTAPRFTPNVFMDHVQSVLPTDFPNGPTSFPLVAGGYTFEAVRAYPNGNYIGVTPAGDIYAIGPFTGNVLTAFGNVGDYTCQIAPSACSTTPRIAGTIKIEVATHTVTPTLVGGMISGTSVGTIDPAQVTAICAESLVLGFDGNTKACGPYVDGKAVIGNVTNNDRVQYTLRTTTPGQYVWLGLNPGETTYWQCEGLNCQYAGPTHSGFVEYSEGGVGYRKPRISVAAGKLILSFGRNQLAGFGLDGVPTSFTGEHFEFVFRSTTNPPTKAYHVWNEATKEYRVVFEGATLKCTDTGNITVHRQVLGSPPNQVHYGDVAGWLSVATPPNPPDLIWGFDSGVTPVVQPPLVGFTYRLPGC